MKRAAFCLAALALSACALSACAPPPPPSACCAAPYVVYFALGSTTLNDQGRTTVENAAATAGRRPPSAAVEVIGHADAVGGAQANAAISQVRAKLVAAALEREGVARDRIILRAAGDTAPVIRDPADERVPENRRVEIYIR